MSVQIEYNGIKYSYNLDTRGVGYWYPTNGKNAYVAVPIMLAQELKKEAISQGISAQVFSPPKKPEKLKSVSVRTKGRKKSIGRGRFSVSLSAIKNRAKSFEESKEE